MPLIWCLNAAGARMSDRVYGPIFMEKFLARVSGDFTHYLLGGSELCGTRLKERFLKINPALRFVGSYHGRCMPDGKIDPTDEKQVMQDLERLKPDFIWIGFGTPKQQAWVKHYKKQISRGVILTVGFAFDVNAGTKPDAPMWMQRNGLTWVFRLCSEPRRLFPRYVKWNGLFLWYLLWDGLRGRAWQRAR
jgi:N-acetylglucosaminyldiphosphoundecaprenol N-acetyl-beta-D-mannosaminyltransferase